MQFFLFPFFLCNIGFDQYPFYSVSVARLRSSGNICLKYTFPTKPRDTKLVPFSYLRKKVVVHDSAEKSSPSASIRALTIHTILITTLELNRTHTHMSKGKLERSHLASVVIHTTRMCMYGYYNMWIETHFFRFHIQNK